MEPTYLEAEAQALGFPATLFGYTPNEAAYWREPGLPWLPAAPADALLLDYRGTRAIRYLLEVIDHDMAPRFPRGCLVQTMPVYERAQLVVGRVYSYGVLDPETGTRHYHLARLVQVGATYLEVKPDHDDHLLRWPLRADEAEATWDVREVTHYAHYPAAREEDAPKAGDYLLQITLPQLGPRYPVGARYWARPVPRAQWADARGVHALQLRDGRELLARLLKQRRGQWVLGFDVGAPEYLALADVVQLWKLGAADYLPEETPDEHRAFLQSRDY